MLYFFQWKIYYKDGAINIQIWKQFGENGQKIIWPFNKYEDHVSSRQSNAPMFSPKLRKKLEIQENLFAVNFRPEILFIFLEWNLLLSNVHS